MSDTFPGFSLPLEQSLRVSERRQELIDEYIREEKKYPSDCVAWDDELNNKLILDLLRARKESRLPLEFCFEFDRLVLLYLTTCASRHAQVIIDKEIESGDL